MRKFRWLLIDLVMLLATAGLVAAKENGTVAVVRGSPTMTIPLSRIQPGSGRGSGDAGAYLPFP